jgi:type IV pilus assembly protein PilF
VRLHAAVLGWLLASALAGCAAPASEMRDLPTASDQSEGERRARARLDLASAYYSNGQLTTALDEVKLALAARPDFAEAYNLRGLIYSALGEERLSEDSYRRALQLNPRDADTLHNFGWSLCQLRRYADADTQFRAALAQPQYQNVARTLMAQGICSARGGQWDAAEKALARSFELEPSNPVTSVNLAEVLYRRGELERARFHIRRVNNQTDLVSAQTLWLAMRIERKLGNQAAVDSIGRDLRSRFPRSSETSAFNRGEFDE